MRWKEAAKFGSGFEAFHALMHASLWLSGTTLHVFGVSLSSQWSGGAALLGVAISLTLGWFGWKSPKPSKSHRD